jgi:predicted dehydrogenase
MITSYGPATKRKRAARGQVMGSLCSGRILDTPPLTNACFASSPTLQEIHTMSRDPQNGPLGPIGRRDFLRTAATAAAAASVATPALGATPAAAQTPSIEPIRVGVVGIDLVTFWGIWADLLSPTGRYLGTSVLRLRPTHVWDKDRTKAEAFAQHWGLEVVDRYDGMLGKVDVVLNGALQSTPWQHQLLRPYLEAGVPCFLQRHWADTLEHLDEMLELATLHNTPIMATVPFEHYPEVDGFTSRLNTIGEVQSAFGTSEIADEPHFHLPYMALKVLGYDVDWVSMTTDDVRRVGYLAINYGYARSETRPRAFIASLHAARGNVFNFNVIGNQGTLSSSMPSSANYVTRFFGQLVDIQKSFERRENYQPFDTIRRKYLCLQAAYYSHVERGGAPVQIGSVPANWAIPAWSPGWYDGSEFL